MHPDPTASIDASRYVSLETRRRNGNAVATPVWFARVDDSWFVFSAADSGKVKRLRHTSDVRVAPCNMRGRVLGGWVSTTAELVDDATTEQRVYDALLGRYGIQMRIANLLSRLSGRLHERQVIRIRIPAAGTA